MKTLVCMLALGASLGLASCRKDRTCECTYSDSSDTQKTTYEKIRKSRAKDLCPKEVTYTSTNGANVTTKCKLD